MYIENPGADMFKKDIYIVSTKNNAAGMRDAAPKMAALALKLAKGEEIRITRRRRIHRKRYQKELLRN